MTLIRKYNYFAYLRIREAAEKEEDDVSKF